MSKMSKKRSYKYGGCGDHSKENYGGCGGNDLDKKENYRNYRYGGCGDHSKENYGGCGAKPKFRMSRSILQNSPRNKKSKMGAADEIVNAANNPSRSTLNKLTSVQLNQVCKLFNIKGCSTKSKGKLVTHVLRGIKEVKKGPPGFAPNTEKKSFRYWKYGCKYSYNF